jgi:DMSO/TMAO reductase YedYZ molybdopterin-dependent catalytic subunit
MGGRGMTASAATVDPGLVCREAIDAGLELQRACPLNAETPMTALNDAEITPNSQFYLRNHFDIPNLDGGRWRLTVGGAVRHRLAYSLRGLRRMPSHTRLVTLECAGNNRAALNPRVPGEQWRLGAVSTAEFTGVPLIEVLERAAPTSRAREVLFRGADRGHVDGHPGTLMFQRSLGLDDAGNADALLAYQMNGAPLPRRHGYPLRLIVPGWYGVASVKWLTEIIVLDHAFEGYFQTQRYRFTWPRANHAVTEPVRRQRVRALITEPTCGQVLPRGEVRIRGLAWSGSAPISHVQVSVRDGHWHCARLLGRPERHAWRRWELLVRLDQPGMTAVRARATDLAGHTQPDTPDWNALGYGANSVQTVAIWLV